MRWYVRFGETTYGPVALSREQKDDYVQRIRSAANGGAVQIVLGDGEDAAELLWTPGVPIAFLAPGSPLIP